MTPARGVLSEVLAALPRWILVGGKGGVGKTTCASALAMESARSGARTLLVSTDPAGSLGDAIGATLTGTPTAIESGTLFAAQLDGASARMAFLAEAREALVAILDRGTYLDRGDVEGLVDATFPGVDETMAALSLGALDGEPWARIVVDTAPTGHTLRLLALPESFRALVTLLDTMQEKHRFMVRALTHRYKADDADALLERLRAEVDGLAALLRDGSRAAMVLVARPEAVVVAETERYAEALGRLGVRIGAVVVNAFDSGAEGAAEAVKRLEVLAGTRPMVVVPLLSEPPIGRAGSEAWSRAARGQTAAPPAQIIAPTSAPVPTKTPPRAANLRESPASAQKPAVASTDLLRDLTFVVGKGGVGKTTVACALAIASADRGDSTFLVSTDPAPSIADALEQPVGDEEVAVEGVKGLVARQMDGNAAFRRFRDSYRARVDDLFDAMLGGGMDVGYDRAIVRDLLTLAPPGIDELYALASLGETLTENRFRRVIVDPAPTGHLLRLLEMPRLALDWSHRLMRLMLKYKDVGGLGDAAGELLGFAKRTRVVQEMLGDPSRAGCVIVMLDEPLVRHESERLAQALSRLGVAVVGVVANRGGAGSPLSSAATAPHLVASASSPAPRGVAAIRAWQASWRTVSMES